MLIAQIAQDVQDNKELLDAQTISLLVGVIIPLVVGLLSKIEASSGLKAVLNALLSSVAGALATVTQVSEANLRDFAVSILSTWVVSVATYYGVWKPTGVAGSVIAKTAQFGIGSPPVVETEDKGVEEVGEVLHGEGSADRVEVELEGTAPDPDIVGPNAGAPTVF